MIRLHGLRRDERGGAMVVMAFVVLAIAIISGITASIFSAQSVELRNQAQRAAEVSIRSTVNVAVTQVNQNGVASLQSLITAAGSAGYSPFPYAANNAVSGTTAITGLSYSGSNITLTLKFTSTGRISFTQTATSVLQLAGATGLAWTNGTAAQYDFDTETGVPVLAIWIPTSMTMGGIN
ncbi:hypothetical protein [Microbacterium ginsengisoli]|nr:hypothetical protein [Microbacteriaceae bacterium K1510]